MSANRIINGTALSRAIFLVLFCLLGSLYSILHILRCCSRFFYVLWLLYFFLTACLRIGWKSRRSFAEREQDGECQRWLNNKKIITITDISKSYFFPKYFAKVRDITKKHWRWYVVECEELCGLNLYFYWMITPSLKSRIILDRDHRGCFCTAWLVKSLRSRTFTVRPIPLAFGASLNATKMPEDNRDKNNRVKVLRNVKLKRIEYLFLNWTSLTITENNFPKKEIGIID